MSRLINVETVSRYDVVSLSEGHLLELLVAILCLPVQLLHRYIQPAINIEGLAADLKQDKWLYTAA